MVKKNKNIIIVIIIIAGLLIIPNLLKEDQDGLGVHYFDKDRNEIFSIITPEGQAPINADYINFEIIASNTGDTDVTDLEILEFEDPLGVLQTYESTQLPYVPIGSSNQLLFTTEDITTSQYETESQPITFRIKLRGIDAYTGEFVFSEYSINITFEEEVVCNSFNYSSCIFNDVYWYNSCDEREERKEDCGISGWETTPNYCYDGDVYTDYNTVGCKDSSCTSNISSIKVEECGTISCTLGVCEEPHSCEEVWYILDEGTSPMGIFGTLGSYPVGTKIYFLDEDCRKIRMQEDDGQGDYYSIFPGEYDITLIGRDAGTFHMYINDVYQEIKFPFETLGICEINEEMGVFEIERCF